MGNLKELRGKIDKIDSRLVDLLNQRADLALQIKKLKLATNLPLLDAEREEEIHQMIKQRNKGPLKEGDLERIYAVLLETMRGNG